MESAVLEYAANQIQVANDRPSDWVLWNGAVVRIEDTLWDMTTQPPTQKYPNYSVQGTVSEAIYALEQGTLIEFLTATC